MLKFEIGKLYRIQNSYDYGLADSIIKITEIENNRYHYEFVSSELDFCIGCADYFKNTDQIANCLEPVEDCDMTITIKAYKSKRIVVATLFNGKHIVNSATAKCHKNDKFDFTVGAQQAFNRLIKNNKNY